MPDLDLEPTDYRGKPEKGQPIFKHGGPKRLLVVGLFFAFAIFAAAVTYWPAHMFSQWLRSLFGG